MRHRHLNDDCGFSLAAIDSFINRGRVHDWIELKAEMERQPYLLQNVLRICIAQESSPYDTYLYRFWKNYVLRRIAIIENGGRYMNKVGNRIDALLSGSKVRDFTIDDIQDSPKYHEAMHKELLTNIKAYLPTIKKLSDEMERHFIEDRFYRFYHHSFKVYDLQEETERIVEMLRTIAPDGVEFCKLFKQIITDGTSKQFDRSCNRNWGKHTRPILEAFWHSREMLKMAAKYGDELEEAPSGLPSGWAALLSLYGIR